MPLAFWCILIAGLMPVATVGIAKFGKGSRGYDNNHPRDWLTTREGRAKRAHAAHLNCFEALPLFIAGVFVAMWMKASPALIDGIAITFIVARIAFVWCYLNDHATPRSAVWVIGMLCNIALFVVAALAK